MVLHPVNGGPEFIRRHVECARQLAPDVCEAAEGARRIMGGWAAHARAARALAEEYFDSDRVLARFLDQAGVAP